MEKLGHFLCGGRDDAIAPAGGDYAIPACRTSKRVAKQRSMTPQI
jgi:hypothetical protein